MQDSLVARALMVAAALLVSAIAGRVHGQGPGQAKPGSAEPAFLLQPFDPSGTRRAAREDVLDTPTLPGSLMKVVTLTAALEHHVIEPDTARMCRRIVTVNGRTYTCAHPDLKRPLLPAEALAYSCNDYFVSLVPRLTRTAFNQVRARLGLPRLVPTDDLAAAAVGLAGPRIAPRVWIDVIGRVAGVAGANPLSLPYDVRQVVLRGLRGTAEYGTASALRDRAIPALAKTGTSPMPGGDWMGLLVALAPADKPTRGIVVVAPGAAGLDAATIAADVLSGAPATARQLSKPPAAPRRSATTIRLSIQGRVTSLDLEEYIARVVAGEGQPKASAAAQQALAITARTFALANLNRHRREGYDLCDTTHCQVMRPATEITRRAAMDTAGEVLVHQKQPATVFYSAWCGGRTELASEVWPGAVDYSSDSHEDDVCRDEPAWASEVRVAELERALRASGLRGDRLRDLRILERNESGRVARVRVEGFLPAEISGHDFRMAVGRVAGWHALKSTAFEVARTSAGFRFSGVGFGHGVGLCVIGAGRRAAQGASAEAILKFYFPTLTVQVWGRPVPTLASAARPATDVLLALPGNEEGERTRVLQIIRSARDEIAGTARVTAPTTLRVTAHPTVEAFARATGQPWWVSGASDGTSIDLLPLAILRQRGQLERTLRHEVAHTLLDRSLAGRPLWVREGAAFYFADPTETTEVSSRLSCPQDEEFLRPLSAGAHRTAYARAEACFRREVSRGRSWRDVR